MLVEICDQVLVADQPLLGLLQPVFQRLIHTLQIFDRSFLQLLVFFEFVDDSDLLVDALLLLLDDLLLLEDDRRLQLQLLLLLFVLGTLLLDDLVAAVNLVEALLQLGLHLFYL